MKITSSSLQTPSKKVRKNIRRLPYTNIERYIKLFAMEEEILGNWIEEKISNYAALNVSLEDKTFCKFEFAGNYEYGLTTGKLSHIGLGDKPGIWRMGQDYPVSILRLEDTEGDRISTLRQMHSYDAFMRLTSSVTFYKPRQVLFLLLTVRQPLAEWFRHQYQYPDMSAPRLYETLKLEGLCSLSE